MKSERRLTVEFCNDPRRAEEYRIRGRQVEFRSCRPDGSAVHDWGSAWRPLTAWDIWMHFAVHSVVGEWLKLQAHQDSLLPTQNPSTVFGPTRRSA